MQEEQRLFCRGSPPDRICPKIHMVVPEGADGNTVLVIAPSDVGEAEISEAGAMVGYLL